MDTDNEINGHSYPEPRTVPATQKFLDLLQGSGFVVLDDFHPGVNGSMTLVDRETSSAITLVIFESSDEDDEK